ncbi:hypothetical protein J5N97_001210 [Dioscorea zingiberensis]|uniref:PROP1-like PPR domain-containing protein n=1 Tax=Dioscorea zingiberensis TaxID=325984 RepID=A0A9D5BUC9_9LILI|nr:hypothetical protein J5N97_001210 [Dioscorea zingiberensis]
MANLHRCFGDAPLQVPTSLSLKPPFFSAFHLPSHRHRHSLKPPTLSLAFTPRSHPNPAIHESIDPLPTNLSPKEQTLLLRSQRDWRRALRLFHHFKTDPHYTPNAIHYNVVLRALGRARRWDELRLCWIDMARDGLLPTNNTYATLIDVYDKAGLPKLAVAWLKHMKSRGVFPDEVTMNTALRVLKDSGRFASAEELFKQWCTGRVDLECLELDSEELELSPISPKQFLLTELFKSGGRVPVSMIGSEEGGGGLRKPRRAATYNTLIDLYGKAGKLQEASDAFAEMLRSCVAPDVITFNTMINVCGSHGRLDEAEALFGEMEVRRVRPDTKTFNIFMSLYATLGNVEVVLMYYRKIRLAGLRPDVVTHRIILQVLCEKRLVNDAENVIDEMLSSGFHVDEQSLPIVIKMYIDEGLLDDANVFFEKHCSGREISSKNYAAIMDAYAEKVLWKEAEDVFFRKRDAEHKKEVVEYNVMVKAYGKAKLYDKALDLFDSMRSYGTWPDECTFNSIIQMLSGAGWHDKARELFDRMKDAGFKPRCETVSALIACYLRTGLISEGVKLYQDMKKLDVQPNEVVYGLLIDAFAESGDTEEALHYFHLMEESGFAANQIVLTSLVKAYSKNGFWERAQELYGKMMNLEGGPDIIASNCMINLYSSLGMVREAKLIFDELRKNHQADGVSYSTMMYLYKSMGMLNEATNLALEMQRSNLLTDCASYNNAMAAYAVNSKLRDCGELLRHMSVRKILPDPTTFKIIFTLLKKGGLPPEAVSQLEISYTEGKPYARQIIITSLFSIVGLHSFALESCETFVSAEVGLDSSAYNVAIHAYGSANEIEKALNLFMRMQDEGLKADLVTYINLACCYGKAGMIEGLKRIYGLLKYGEIEPSESLFRALINAYNGAGKHDLARKWLSRK